MAQPVSSNKDATSKGITTHKDATRGKQSNKGPCSTSVFVGWRLSRFSTGHEINSSFALDVGYYWHAIFRLKTGVPDFTSAGGHAPHVRHVKKYYGNGAAYVE